MLLYLAIAFSLANLVCFPLWQAALHYPNEYYYDTPSAGRSILAVALVATVLSGLLWVGALTLRSWGDRTARALGRSAFLALLLVPLNHVRTNLGESGPLIETAGKATVILVAVLVLAGIYATLRGAGRPALIARLAVLVFLPYGLLAFGQGAWVLAGGRDALFRQIPPAPAIAADHGQERPRALWIIFDQLDQELTFETRPGDVRLPALDRLREEALSAEQAYAPAGWTLVSLPALLTGRLVERAKPASASELWLKFTDQTEPELWGVQPSVFSRARARQLDTALVGNYHPYCRILGDLVSCYSVSYREGVPDPCGSVACMSVREAVGLIYRLPLMDRVPWIRLSHEALSTTAAWDEARAGIERFRSIHRRALELATDPAMDLVFLHYPVPHGPIIFNRSTGDFLQPGEAAGRFDNMVLADRALGELRAAMEAAGLWERTAVLVSADHGEKDLSEFAYDTEGRRIERRVPFILKLPLQDVAVRYAKPMNTVISQDLVLAILDGEVADATSLVAWLDNHVTFGPSPVFPGNEN